MRDAILYGASFGFVGGIALSSLTPFGYVGSFFVLLLAAVMLSIYFLGTAKASHFLLSGIFLLGVSAGVIRSSVSAENTGDAILRNNIGESIISIGKLVDEPDDREFNTKFTFRAEVLKKGDSEIRLATKTKILVTGDRGTDLVYGDTVKVQGELAEPETFMTDNGRSFDYKPYLRKDGIFYEIKHAKVSKVKEASGSVRGALFSVKRYLLAKIEAHIPEPKSALMGGLILGTKQSLGETLRTEFVRTGTIHIVALSGYNVTIVAEMFMRILGLVFAQTIAIYFGIVAIILFALMTGAGATVVRASVMAILALVARRTGRVFAIGRALVIAGVVMILVNPWILIFDVSFQLSFIATIGLVYLTPRISHWFYFIPDTFGLREIVSATVATNIFVLPFILYKMGILSIVALPANLLVLPLIPYTMLFGFLMLLGSTLSRFLALPFAYLAFWLLSYELAVIHWFSGLGFAAVTVGTFPFVLVIIVYCIYLRIFKMLPKSEVGERNTQPGLSV